jgi:peptide deformylase
MGETIHRELSGWPARVWQHETDHLNGFLYDDNQAGKCTEKHQFASRKEIDDFYKKMRA